MRAVVSLLFILIFHSGVNAFTLDNKLRDKSMEKRATSLFEIIRCPICSGESLSESGSQIAYDMRGAIRKKINDGYTDEEIISELKNSYGNSIIIVPPSTYILWFIPLTTLLIGCFLIQRYINTTT
ncbi:MULTISPECIES: cytochrome c-type biogenesis protein [Wolbachia]|uniref:cytochrome c-type biogenesis protein n=1 Tax=Wolbachia TaxID=953 RepID=UPI0007EED516|nr:MULTISPECIES: cytochrome c-type biogenesis protein CcmH [Wolbachia]MBA8758175.1 cytochrome c-type biogenesis protein CcmH [Wolbachia pipientis]MBA8770368.1 cytochrome c-type biogenesis protein CcmH [Wolbachia pipientis]